MTKRILPAPKMSYSKRALRLALLPIHEKNKPIYASTLRISSTATSPTILTLPPLISPLSLEPSLTPLTLQQPGTTVSSSGTIIHQSPKPSPLSPWLRFRQKQDRVRKTPAIIATAGGPRPAYPSPTRWRCHICRIKYVIGVTRRCLRDGHFLCFPVAVENSQLCPKQIQDQPSVGDVKVAAEDGRNEKAKAVIALRQMMKARSRSLMKANRISRACAVKFDYEGWSAYGAWKRKGKSGIGMPCEKGCDWPGECKERKRITAEEVRKSKRLEKIAEMVTYRHHFCSVS